MTTPRVVLLSLIIVLIAVIVGVPFLVGAKETAFTTNADKKVEEDGTFTVQQGYLWLPDETRGPLLQNWLRQDFRVRWVGYRCISGYIWVEVHYQGQIRLTSQDYIPRSLLPEAPKCQEPKSGGHIYGDILVVSLAAIFYLSYRFSR